MNDIIRKNLTFYDMSEDDRIALTMRAIEEQRTVYERWQTLAGPEAEPWNARASLAARLLQGEAAVADLGCGVMTLERFLAPGTEYLPIDIVARDDRTIVCDFNVEPVTIKPHYAAACLGLIEYILKPDEFIGRLSQICKICVVSYCITDAPKPMSSRRAHAWVNDFSQKEFERLFTEHGWQIERSELVDDLQMMWRLRIPA